MRDGADAPVSETCWILTDGAAGAENPCLGLAEALGAKALVKRIAAPLLGGLIPPQWPPPAGLSRAPETAGTPSSRPGPSS